MAFRWIRGVVKDRHGIILAVCLREPGGPVVSVTQVVDDLTAGRNSYVVDAGASPARINVVHEGGRTYLRTSPDADPANNLDALPDCGTLQPIDSVPVRRNVATVDADERRRLRDAILELNHRTYPRGVGLPDPVSIWFKQDEIHQATHVHRQATFLAWHRVLLNEFEAQLQQIDPTLALHYWDWTTHPRRTPNGRGGTVDLFDADFMGSEGPTGIGSPFLEHSFYRPTPPNRDFDAAGTPRGGRRPADLPPVLISRMLPVSGRGPAEVTLADRDELWPRGFGLQPAEELMRIRSDEALLRPTLDGRARPGVAFERFWRALYVDHGLAHRFIGGNIGGGRTSDPAHTSFEDPFVFLLHSNVDRLWASWQLSPNGFEARAEPAWRLEPPWIYGHVHRVCPVVLSRVLSGPSAARRSPPERPRARPAVG